jgi:hypothetical protein
MRDPHRAVCGRCLDDFADIWALKRHQENCLRRQSPDLCLSGEDIEVAATTRAS